jgi:hypothetical protein
MKYLSTKKLERMYYRITYSFETNTYKRELFLIKKAIITFLGLPLFATKEICVTATKNDLKNHSVA